MDATGRVAQLFAVGDIYFNRSSIEKAYSDLEPLFREADLRFCNYEAPITSKGTEFPGRTSFNVALKSPLNAVQGLKSGFFDVISLANNHMLDYGIEGLEETLQVLDKQDIVYVGAGRTTSEATEPVIINKNGISFGFLAFACAFPYCYAATYAQPGIAAVHIHTSYVPNHPWEDEHPGVPPNVVTSVNNEDLKRVREAVSKLKDRVDHVIVSYHWGIPGQHDLVDYQRALAYATIDAGASIILGHHAHVLQGVEIYQGGVVIYGLSNFLFDLEESVLSQYGSGKETVGAMIKFGHRDIREVIMIPIIMEETGPRRALQKEGRGIFRLLCNLSEPLSTEFDWDSETNTLRLRL